MKLSDLEPVQDVTGGSPKTPVGGIPRMLYEDQPMTTTGNGVWRALAAGAGGLWVMTMLAWFTAFAGRGVTQKDMQDYVDKYSPYVQQKDVIAQQQSRQDQEIGSLIGKQEHLTERMAVIESTQKDQDRDIQDCKIKMKLAADYMEEQRRLRK